MKTRSSSLLVAAAIVFSLTVVDLQAGDRFVDTHNPTGLPDITQSQVQDGTEVKGGICAAATAANFMWDLSDAHMVGTQPLVDHPASENPVQNWPTTFGNWSADSLALRDSLKFYIYQQTGSFLGVQVWSGGNGTAGGVEKYLANRGYKYSRGIFGGGNPNGLSVRTYNKDEATYQTLYGLVINGDNNPIDENVAASMFWHNPDGSVVMNDNGKSRHSLGVAGVNYPSTGDPGNQHIYFTNGWGTQQDRADPVSNCYYDRYDNIIIDNSGGNNPNNRFRIPAGAAVNPAPPGCAPLRGHPNSNNDLVRGIGTKSAKSDYVEMYQITLVKPGGSPEVGLEVDPAGSQNQFRYRVYNPEIAPMEHFFLEVGSDVLNGLSLSQAVPPPGWGVEFWKPAGMSTDRVSSLNPTGAPDDGMDLFGPTFAIQGTSDHPRWEPNWGGLHFYWTGQAGTEPIETGEILDFSLYLSSSAFGVDSYRLLLTVVGQESNDIDYYSVIGGPVALPQQPASISVIADENLNRLGDRFLIGLQFLNAGGSQAKDVTVTSVVAAAATLPYLGSTLPVDLGPVSAGGAVYMTAQVDVTGVATGSQIPLSVGGTFTDSSGKVSNFSGVVDVQLIGP